MEKEDLGRPVSEAEVSQVIGNVLETIKNWCEPATCKHPKKEKCDAAKLAEQGAGFVPKSCGQLMCKDGKDFGKLHEENFRWEVMEDLIKLFNEREAQAEKIEIAPFKKLFQNIDENLTGKEEYAELEEIFARDSYKKFLKYVAEIGKKSCQKTGSDLVKNITAGVQGFVQNMSVFYK